jgi:hypothetical protein
MFRHSHTIIRELINLCLLKLQLLKESIKIYWCVVNTVVVWLHILVGPCWCVYVALFNKSLLPNSATHIHQQGPTNICSHTTTLLTTQRCILMDFLTTATLASTN